MKCAVRIIIIAVSLAEGVGWTWFASMLWGLGNAFGGSGDGTGSQGDLSGEMVATLIIAIAWLFLASPYLCMVAGSLNLITGKSLRVAYAYSLALLSLMTVIELVSFQRIFLVMALGNIVAGGLWAWSFRAGTLGESDTPQV